MCLWPDHVVIEAAVQDALQDALHMITEPHSVQITCPGTKKKEEDEHKEGDEHEPRTLSELEVQVIKEWYDKKDKELEETRGEAYITERNLSTAARQYHNDSMNAHAKTHEGLEDVKKSNADERNRANKRYRQVGEDWVKGKEVEGGAWVPDAASKKFASLDEAVEHEMSLTKQRRTTWTNLIKSQSNLVLRTQFKMPDKLRKRDRSGYKRPDAGKRPRTHSVPVVKKLEL